MAESLPELLDALQAALVPPTRHAAQLPAAGDLAFERSLSRKIARTLDAQQETVLSIAQKVLDWAAPPQGESATSKSKSGAAPTLDADLLREGVYDPVTERVELLLERADDAVEKHLGLGKHRPGSASALGAKSAAELERRDLERNKAERRLPARLLHDATLEKPQKKFTGRTRVAPPAVDDQADGVPLWKPILRTKTHALAGDREQAQQEGWLATELYEPKSSYTQTTATVPPPYTRYVHPYATELAALTPPAHFLKKPAEPAPHPPASESFDKTPFEWVGDKQALDRMVEEIRQVGEAGLRDLAIDLEHHDYRSWSGMTCLMQLSTRKKDYVIDALEPGVRDNLEALNEFFTDPKWVKVLHGANSDIVWLQRDFGLYIVGLFDTYLATKVLGYSQHSLASLLAMYTDFEPDKRYQLADWRIRPMPQEMLQYARSDTHYLLSIYDHLRRALHAKERSAPEDPSLLEDVYQRSIGVSSITFSLPPFDHETGHFDWGFLLPLAKHGVLKAYATALAIPTLPLKTGWGPSEVRFETLRELVRWRERTARDEDESGRYVLSVQGLLQLAEVGAAGGVKDANDVVRVLGNSRGGVSEVVRRRKSEVALLVKETVERVAGSARDGDGRMDDGGSAAAMAISSAQLGLPAAEPAVRPLAGVWDMDLQSQAGQRPVASTSSLPATVVSVSVAAASALFGPSSTAAASPGTGAAPLVSLATSSAFFGPSATASSSSKKGKNRAQPEVDVATTERERAVKRVHDSLVLGGGLGQSLQPKPIQQAAAAPSDAAVDADTVLPDAAPVPNPEHGTPAALSADHTYVPLSDRIPKEPQPSALSSSTMHVAPKPKDSDVIVVSSLKDKPKKRRRQGSEAESAAAGAAETGGEKKPKAKKVKSDDGGDSGANSSVASPAPADSSLSAKKKEKKAKKRQAQSDAAAAAPIVPHDYSQSTSILDADPGSSAAAIADKKERRKQERIDKLAGTGGKKKGFEIDLSDFRRAPRVANAPKKANVSKSFAK